MRHHQQTLPEHTRVSLTKMDKKKIKTEAIKSAISNYFFVAIANTLTSLLLYFSLINSPNINILLLNSWLLSQLLLGGILTFVHFRYAIDFEPIRGIWDWYIDMPINLWGGLGWGMCWALFIDPADIHTAFFLNTAICGVVLGIVVTNPLDQRALLATLLPCLLPVIITALWLGGELFNWIALIATVFLAAAYAFSRVLQKLYMTILEERELSQQLVLKLGKEKAKIEKANQEKTRFLAAASHDLRQPIQAIRLYEGLLSVTITDNKQKHLLQKISAANNNLTALLESLLDMSKLDSGIVTANPENIFLNELFDTFYEQYADRASAQSIQLTIMPNSHIRLYTDPFHLQRILNNLLENAICHMGRPGKILLGARQFGNMVYIEVHDNGIGISASQQDDVFKEFYQVENEGRNRSKGLGLGLSIVKRLADLNNYDITLTAKPGRGCCFRVCIPQANRHALSLITQQQPAKLVQVDSNTAFLQIPENTHVLVLDDTPEIADALAALLMSWGLKVNQAHTLYAAMEVSRKHKPALILTDYVLSHNQTGLEAIDQLREQIDVSLPAIILTGNTSPEVMNQLSRQDISILFKPIQDCELKAAIVQELAKSS